MKYLFNGIEVVNPIIEIGPCRDLMRGTGALEVNIQVHMGETIMPILVGTMNYDPIADNWQTGDVEIFVATYLADKVIQEEE